MSFTLPPLNALRAFESAARHGSYVAAAGELNVSPAAISQHVRNLEGFLGKRLFTRHNNRVVLTDAGEEIFKNVHQALETISLSTARAMGTRVRSRLVISALPSLAEYWLVPRLQAFTLIHPDFHFDLRLEADPVDFGRQDIDLRLAYGALHYPDFALHPLVQDELVPICAPSFLQQKKRNVEDGVIGLADEDFIHTDWGAEFGSRPSWQDWFARFGQGRSVTAAGHQVSHSALAQALAERGLGVTLGQKMMAAEAIKLGRLVTLSTHTLPLGHRYYLVHPKAKADKAMLKALVTFLGIETLHHIVTPAKAGA